MGAIVSAYQRKNVQLIKLGNRTIKIVPEVGIEEFFCEPYFIGESTRKDAVKGGAIFGIWQKALKEIYSKREKSEVILTGGIGLGKSMCADIGIAYSIYRILRLENPQDFLGCMTDDSIVIAFINLTLDLSDSGNVVRVINMLQRSRAFTDLGVRWNTRTALPTPILPKNVMLTSGSAFAKGFGIVGKNIITGVLDEISEVRSNAKSQIRFSQKKALDLYRTAARRIKSRFMKKCDFAKLYLVSSKQEKDQFLEQYVEKVKNEPHILVYDFPLWEARPENYSGKKFYVGINKLCQPLIEDRMHKIPKNYKVYAIPVEHKPEFRLDPITALADIAGVNLNMHKMKFFRNLNKLKCAFLHANLCPDTIELSLYDDRDIISCFNMEELLKFSGQKLSIHIDTSWTKDLTGISASYLIGKEKVDLIENRDNYMDLMKDITGVINSAGAADRRAGKNEDTIEEIPVVHPLGKLVSQKTITIPRIRTLFALGIVPRDEIPLFKIRQFIYTLRKLGFKIAIVTMDGYQSVDMQ